MKPICRLSCIKTLRNPNQTGGTNLPFSMCTGQNDDLVWITNPIVSDWPPHFNSEKMNEHSYEFGCVLISMNEPIIMISPYSLMSNQGIDEVVLMTGNVFLNDLEISLSCV